MSTTQPAAVIQARIHSSRFPGKSLQPLGKRTLLEYVVRRTHRALPDPILAIPDTPGNDVIQEQAQTWPCRIVRGPEEDVLSRFYRVLQKHPRIDPVVRVTGDNPLISPQLMVQGLDHLGNAAWGSFRNLPLGIGAGVFRKPWIERAHRQANGANEREHVTLWIKRHSGATAARWDPPMRFRAPGLRLTVDTPRDWNLILRLHAHFGEELLHTESDVILEYLAGQPELIRVNARVDQEVYKSKQRILFCLNRGKTWGQGHWRRYQILRQALNRSSLERHPEALLGQIGAEEQTGCLAEIRGALSEKQILRWSRRSGAGSAVLDRKDSSLSLVKQLQKERRLVVGLEERGTGRSRMDAVVDPNLYEGILEEDDVPEGRRFYGPRYAMIDPEFRTQRLQKAPGGMRKVGVFFGGTDPSGLSEIFAAEVAPAFSEIRFHLFGLPVEIQTSANVRFEGFRDDPARSFASMNFMVISGGVTKFEIGCLRVPALIIAQNEEQWRNSHRFIQRNNLQWNLFRAGSSVDEWKSSLARSSEPDRLAEMFESTRDVVDGRGTSRFLEILEAII